MGIVENIQKIRSRIRRAEGKYNRPPNSVRLLAVSKSQPASFLRCAYDGGQKAFGENYVQEARAKKSALANCDIEWHFIGSIQTNKTKKIAENFDWVHSVNRSSVARRLQDQRPKAFPPINVCIEVNLSHEGSKSGALPEKLLALATEVSQLDQLRLRGLMLIPPLCDTFSRQKAVFSRLLDLQQDLIEKGFVLDTLSMGMSQDFEAAIAAGSTLVRIGTAIFGARV